MAAWCGLTAFAAAAPSGRKDPPKPPKPPKPKRVAVVPAVKPVANPAGSRAAVEFFEREVRPVLAAQCYACHGDKIQQAGLRLDSREALLKGGDKGPSFNAKEPAKSLFLTAIHHQGGLKMPPAGKLPAKQLAALEKWIALGAPWPAAPGAAAAKPQTWEEAMRARKRWWSLQPVRPVVVPTVRNKKWSAQPVDLFLLAQMEKKGIQPVGKADRRTLARRVHLLLTGLPPAPEEVERFVNDRSPNAYGQLVDRVLASPHYGERWARHWMDVVRFGETHGYEWNHEVRDVWRYRDYLIRAFNQDVPYDQLIKEHLAGDLLPNPRQNRAEHIKNESIIGTAFYRFGEVGHDTFKEIGLDHLDNMIDTTSKAFQATTISCARCHDHKLDAISTKDYYALLGILASSRQVVHTLDDDTVNAARKQRLRELKSQLRLELAALWHPQAKEAGRYLRAAQAARDKAPNAAELAQGLDAGRLKAWTTALEKKKPGLEDYLTPWQTAADAAKANADVAAAWKGLAEKYEAESKARVEFNAKNFTPWGDFRNGVPPGWRGDGLALRDGASPAGEFMIANEGSQVVTGIFPAGFYTHALSERLNASFQSPYLPKENKFLSIEVMGGRSGAARLVPDFRLLEDGSDLKQPDLQWKRFRRNDRDERAYIELATKLDNIRYPGWGGGDKGEAFKDPRSFFGVTRAYIHEIGESPKDELTDVKLLFEGEAATLDAVGERYAAVLDRALSEWALAKTTDDQARWLGWMVRAGLVSNAPDASPKVAELVKEYREVEKDIQPGRVVAGMADLDGFDHPVYRRGDFRSVGDMVPRRYLEALASPDMSPGSNSGRLQLAEEIADPSNPLTARVMVNRIWHYLFGTGIVRTPDDFGHMGEEPSHPALLDYLAARFVKNGWSVKKIVRELVLTQAFQMSSQAAAKGKAVDPENRLLHHFPARRLEAEAIRDGILATSGRLDGALYGPSIQPYRVEPMPERRLFPGPLDGNGRRSIYTKITLMQGPAFLEVFNFPDPKTAMGRRDVTNVPAQALTMLNDPFVIQQAEVWADRLVQGTDASIGARVDRMFRRALGRPARPQEVQRFGKAARELAVLNEVPPADVLKSKPVWKDMAHAVFNLKEFIYVR
jgi:hypothetical protein